MTKHNQPADTPIMETAILKFESDDFHNVKMVNRKGHTFTAKSENLADFLSYEYDSNREQQSDAITEEALRGIKGFNKNKKGVHTREYILHTDQGLLSVIFYPYDSPTVFLGDHEYIVEFDCRTISDIKTLIRLLGGGAE